MKLDGKIIAVLGLLAVAGIVAWYFLFRKAGSAAAIATKTLAAPTGLGPADTACLKQLLDYFKANTTDNGSALTWLLPYVDGVLDGTNPQVIDPSYMVSGKIPKSGAFMAVYSAAYFKEDGSGMALKPNIATPLTQAQRFDDRLNTGGFNTQRDVSTDAAATAFNNGLYSIFNTYKNQALQQELLQS